MLCPPTSNYVEEAMTERLIPGTGDLPLLDVLAVIPTNVVIGIEIPMYSQARAGVGPRDRLDPCVAAARDLLRQAHK